MDRLDAMSILLAVVDQGSLSGAARRLGMPLATVSRRMSDLEAHLRARLFLRSSRRIALTEAGQAYVAACRGILEQVEEAERGAAGEYSAPKGALTITAPIEFGRLHVLPVVTGFLEASPEIDARLVLIDRLVDLVDEHVDLAVRIGELPDSALIASRVGETRRVICASPAYLRRHGVPRSAEALQEHACITFDGLASARAWRLGGTMVPVRSRLVVNTAQAAVEAAVAGLGLTQVLCYQTARAREAGELALVLEELEPPPWPVSLVHLGQGPVPLKVRAFLDYAAPRLRIGLAALD